MPDAFARHLDSDQVAALWGGWRADDVAIGGTQKLKVSMVNEAMQTTSYHGLNAGSAYDSYDNGFWIWKADAALGCSSAKYIPYMSGFGGISVVLLPNNMVYYFFSDTAKELNKIGNFCYLWKTVSRWRVRVIPHSLSKPRDSD